MKKLINASFIYAILALVSGVFYREFTRGLDFADRTTLSVMHVHLFVLGSLVFLLLVLFEKEFKITKNKSFNKFFVIYNLGLIFMIAMFVWRGINQVLGLNGGAMISGIAGISHIIFSVGIVIMFIIIRKEVLKSQKIS